MPHRPRVVTFTGSVYRATTYDVPLWVNANRRGGRWNRAGVDSTQYFCLDSEAPYAEMLRGEDLRSEEEAALFATVLWELRIDEGAIADYTTFEKAEAAGFPAAALVDDDHERCRGEAERLKAMNFHGVLSPSAALPGSTNLTLFGPRSPVRWSTAVKLASTIPTQRLTKGSAPEGLVAHVRFYGQPHPALLAYIESLAPVRQKRRKRRGG